MSNCETCKKEMYEGHVMFNNEFKLCSECFNKFYGEDKLVSFMYDNKLQYFTDFEEEYSNLEIKETYERLNDLRERLTPEGSRKIKPEDFMLLDIVIDLYEDKILGWK